MEISNNSKKMINKYYVTIALRSLMFYIPIMALYFEYVLDNLMLVGVLFSIKTITTLIFEIPTGVIADKYSRKFSVILGIIFNLISMLIFITTDSFIWFAIAQASFGIASTFYSGADTALVYDNLKYNNEEFYFDNVIKNKSLISSIALFLSFSCGSYLYSLNKILPFACVFISLLFALFIMFTFEEAPYSKQESAENKEFFPKQFKNLPSSLWKFIILGSILGASFITIYLYLVPIILKTCNIPDAYFGIILAIAVLVDGFAGKHAGIVKNNTLFLQKGLSLSMSLILLLVIFNHSSLSAILFLLGMRILWGIFDVIYTIELNKQITNSEIRSSVISINSALEGGISSIMLILLSVLMEVTNLTFVLVVLIALFLSISVFYNFKRE